MQEDPAPKRSKQENGIAVPIDLIDSLFESKKETKPKAKRSTKAKKVESDSSDEEVPLKTNRAVHKPSSTLAPKEVIEPTATKATSVVDSAEKKKKKKSSSDKSTDDIVVNKPSKRAADKDTTVAQTSVVQSQLSPVKSQTTEDMETAKPSQHTKKTAVSSQDKTSASKKKRSSLEKATPLDTLMKSSPEKMLQEIEVAIKSSSTASASEKKVREELAKLQSKYEALKNLRTTEVEKLYEESKKQAAANEQAQNEIISLLKAELASYKTANGTAKGKSPALRRQSKGSTQNTEEEVDILRQQVKALQEDKRQLMARVTSASSKSNVALSKSPLTTPKLGGVGGQVPLRTVEDQCKVIALYETVTGLRIAVHEERPQEFICHIENPHKNRAVDFTLALEDEEIGYMPLQVQMEPGILPEYFHDDISFEQEEAPLFLDKMVSSVFKK
eukprot:GILK01002267.1.p1 GENE.GILK01002267.1~~GILK01002267.1.p1  ORF type:complete len:521 (-),score=133.92 GILK01002267.1:297-1631(-)